MQLAAPMLMQALVLHLVVGAVWPSGSCVVCAEHGVLHFHACACRFDTVYCDDNLRVAQDIRGDTLIVTRDGPPRIFT